MYRLTPISELSSSSKNIVLWQGQIEEYDPGLDSWDEATGLPSATAILQWATDGFEVIPESMTDIEDVLFGEETRYSPPTIIQLNTDGIDELDLGSSVLVDIVNENGEVVDFDEYSVSFNADDHLIINLSGINEWVKIYLTEIESVEHTLTSSEDTIVLDGYSKVCGIRKSDNTFTREWSNISYENDETIITFPASISSDVEIMVDETNILVTDMDDSNTQTSIPSEYPVYGLDRNNNLVDLYPVLRTGETVMSISHLSGDELKLLVPSWIYGQLLRSDIEISAIGEGGEEEQDNLIESIRTGICTPDFSVKSLNGLQQALSLAKDGDIIQICKSVINLDSVLTVNTKVTLVGAGSSSQLIINGDYPVFDVQADGVAIRNLHLREGSQTGRTEALIKVTDSDNTLICNNLIETEYGPAVEEVGTSSNSVITDNVLLY